MLDRRCSGGETGGRQFRVAVPGGPGAVPPLASRFEEGPPPADHRRVQIPLVREEHEVVGGGLVAGGVGGEQVVPGPGPRLGDEFLVLAEDEVHQSLFLRGEFARELLGVGRLRGRAPQRGDRRLEATPQDAVKGVVIGLGDGVEFVVVAPGARDGQPHQPARDGVDAVVDDVVDVPHEVAADGQEPEGRQGLLVLEVEPVGRNLFRHEPVERQVAVERPDDVIPVGPRPRVLLPLEEDVPLVVGVPGHVEPVPAPALAVVGGGQQAIDDFLVGVRGLVRLERGDFTRRRRQPEEVEREAADQRPPVGLRGGPQLLLGQFRPEERVHRGARAVPRNLRPLDGPEGPVIGRHGLGLRLRRREQRGPGGPRSAEGHPFLEGGHAGVGELPVRRHLHFAGVLHGRDQTALGRLAGDDDGAVGPTREGRVAGVEPKARLLDLRPVAGHAPFDQGRADRPLEEFLSGRGGVAKARRVEGDREGQPADRPAVSSGSGYHARSPGNAPVEPAAGVGEL